MLCSCILLLYFWRKIVPHVLRCIYCWSHCVVHKLKRTCSLNVGQLSTNRSAVRTAISTHCFGSRFCFSAEDATTCLDSLFPRLSYCDDLYLATSKSHTSHRVTCPRYKEILVLPASPYFFRTSNASHQKSDLNQLGRVMMARLANYTSLWWHFTGKHV